MGKSTDLICIDDFYRTIRYLSEKIEGVFGTNVLPPYLLKSLLIPLSRKATQSHCPDHQLQATKAWMNFLKQEEFDFECLGEHGETRLRFFFSRSGLAIVRLLHEFGANIHAIDNDGRNALHYAMGSNCGPKKEFPELLEEKVSLLIEAGVDPHHCDNHGITPSIYAMGFCGCWSVWRRALERNGLSIDEVVREEGNSWLLEPDSAEESGSEETDAEDSDTGEDSLTYSDAEEECSEEMLS